jgi:hypothetical protein
MITEDQVLAKLDDYKLGYYCQFIDLGQVIPISSIADLIFLKATMMIGPL